VLRTKIQYEDGLMGHRRNHYYNGVRASATTRCCSALALIGCVLATIHAAPKADPTPLLLFPARPVWTLALNNQLTLAPVFDATHAFFSIDGDRLVCYELFSGTQQWIASAQPQMPPAVGDALLFVVQPAELTALKIEDGTIAWQLPFEERL